MLQQTVINTRKRLVKARKIKSREKREEKFTRILRRGKGFGVNEITNTTSLARRSMNTILVVYSGGGGGGGMATAFDLAAFPLSMIAPVKKSVNHSRTVASMRETGWEQQQHSSQRFDNVK